MLLLILLVAGIVLIDMSGNSLSDSLVPLVYVKNNEDCDDKDHDISIEDGLSPEEIAEKAQEHIFDRGDTR